MAIVIIGVSSLGLVVTMQQAVVNVHKPQVIATATALAEEVMEAMMMLNTYTVGWIQQTNFTGSLSAYSYSLMVTPIDGNHDELVVTVYHPVIGSLNLAFVMTSN